MSCWPNSNVGARRSQASLTFVERALDKSEVKHNPNYLFIFKENLLILIVILLSFLGFFV